MLLVIGISGKAGHGKDSVVNFMSDFFKSKNVLCGRICFADKLKRIAMDLFDLDEYHVYDQEGKKEKLKQFNEITGREILQLLGTNIARSIYPNIWLYNYIKELKKIKNSIDPCLDTNIIAFTPDMRFKNEYQLICDLPQKYYIDSITIRVERPGFEIDQNNHISENDLDNIEEWDYTLTTPSLDQLKRMSISVASMIYTEFFD